MTDRRRHSRVPYANKVVLKGGGQGSESGAISIYLRDISEGGISGTCFGNVIPAADEVLLLDLPGAQSRKVKLVWSHKTIESVYMLGFKFVN